MMARKTMGRRRDRGGRPEERGRGPGRRPRARAAAWSRSLNGCDGKEDTLAPAKEDPLRRLYVSGPAK